MALVEINWQPTRRDLRIFGMALAGFCAVIAWLCYRNDHSFAVAETVWTGIAVLAAGLAVFAPPVLRPVYLGFTIAAFPIGWAVSHVALAMVFYLVFTPIGLVMRLCGRDPMHRRFDRDAPTYWVDRPAEKSLKDYFRQS